jgi:NADPH:quinone reductase-like Zn-dependent oxidoreductase
MHAIEVEHTGGPEVLALVDKPQPSPGPGQVVIKAEAIGVNFVDTYFRSGLYPPALRPAAISVLRSLGSSASLSMCLPTICCPV